MTKRKQDNIGDPWEIEIAYFIAKGSDPDKARIGEDTVRKAVARFRKSGK
jgi:hypothetical protein